MARVRDTRFITVTGAVLMSVGFGGASCATRVSGCGRTWFYV